MRLRANHPALEYGVTIHPKTVKPLNDYTSRLLKPASGNAKLGAGSNVVTKGKWSGMPMYTLTLEERSTCSRTCLRVPGPANNGIGASGTIWGLLTGLVRPNLNYWK